MRSTMGFVGLIAVFGIFVAVGLVSKSTEPPGEELKSPSRWLQLGYEAALRIKDEKVRRELLTTILRYQAQGGDLKAAEKTRGDLKSQWKGSEFDFLRTIAETYAEAGQIDAAIEAAESAKKLFPGKKPQIGSMFGEIVREQANQGDIAGARALAEQIRDPEYRKRALSAVAYHEANRDLDAAIKTLQSAPGNVPILVLGRKIVESRRWDLLSQIINDALQKPDAQTLRTIAGLVPQADPKQLDQKLVEELRRAIVRLSQQPKPENVSQLNYQNDMRAAVEAMISLKMYDEAQQAIEKLSEHPASALKAQLAGLLAEEGKYEVAGQLAREAWPLHDPFRKVAVAQAGRGDFELAKKTAKRIADNENRNWAYHDIARIEAERGLFSNARKTLKENVHPVLGAGHQLATAAELRTAGLQTIAREQQAKGLKDEAQKTLEEILEMMRLYPEMDNRNSTIESAARVYAEGGSFDRARELAEKIESVDTLLWLARKHLDEGRKQEYQKALGLAEGMLDPKIGKEGKGISSYMQIAALHLKAGAAQTAERWIGQLLRATHRMESTMYKMLSYAMVASFYIHTDQLETLWPQIRAIPDPTDRALAAIGVAIAQLEPEEWMQAWREPITP